MLLVDSNSQRSEIAPCDKGKAYKMKLEAIKRLPGRPAKDNCAPVRHNSETPRSVQSVAEDSGESKTQIQRYIRLTQLIPELQDFVDEGRIKMRPAVELSYLRPEEQQNLIEAMDFTQAAPSLSQAMRLKKLSQEGGCKLDDMCEILGEIKKGDLERVAFKSEQLRKYFPKSYTPRQMSDVILKLLDQWQKKRQRDKAR